VQYEPRVSGQPALDGRRLVSRGLVEHDMNGELGGDLSIDGLQDLLELDRAMAAVQAPATVPVARSSAAPAPVGQQIAASRRSRAQTERAWARRGELGDCPPQSAVLAEHDLEAVASTVDMIRPVAMNPPSFSAPPVMQRRR
jgi:hypothetical protein